MSMSKLEEARSAIRQLKELGLPVSQQQWLVMDKAKEQYVQEELIPRLRKMVLPFFKELGCDEKIVLDYDSATPDEIKIYPCVKEKKETVNSSKEQKRRLKVKTSNGDIICQDIVWETLRDVILYAGVDNVRKLNIMVRKVPLLDSKNTYKVLGVGQKEIRPGVYMATAYNVNMMYKQIKTISEKLNLRLQVEIVA